MTLRYRAEQERDEERATMADPSDEWTVSYVCMDEGTRLDYAIQAALARPIMAETPQRLLAYMDSLHHTFPGGQIDRYAHSLQTATRAEDAGECEELVVAGLLHDIGDSLAPHNHGIIGAENPASLRVAAHVLDAQAPRRLPGVLLLGQDREGQE